MEEKITITIKEVLENQVVALVNGEQKTLDIGSKLVSWYRFTTEKDYEVNLEDNTITYAKIITDNSKPKEEKSAKEEKPTTKKVISPYEDKQNSILAQSTLKEAVNISITQKGPDVTLDYVKEVHKELIEHMKSLVN